MAFTTGPRARDFNPNVSEALAQIARDFGVKASALEKRKMLRKFGRNVDVGTSLETIWLVGGDEDYPANGTNPIDRVVSTDAGDTQEMRIEGHTDDGTGKTFVSQDITLDGTNPVTLPIPLNRANRLFNIDSTDLAGTVTVYRSVGAQVHLATEGNNNQSLKAATAMSRVDFFIVTGLMGSVNRQQTRSVDFRLQVREYGKVFRTRELFSVSSTGGTIYLPLEQPLIVPPNADIRMRAVSSGTATAVDATISGELAIIVP